MKVAIITKRVTEGSNLVAVRDFPVTTEGLAEAKKFANDELRRYVLEGRAAGGLLELEGFSEEDLTNGTVIANIEDETNWVYLNGGEEVFIAATSRLL